jgi:hypothetical protein
MAQRIVMSAHEGIRDAQQLVAVAEGIRDEPPPVSYGDSARGRPRSRLAGGAWSRWLQARLGRVCSYDLSKSAAAFTQFVTLSAREARRHGSSRL